MTGIIIWEVDRVMGCGACNLFEHPKHLFLSHAHERDFHGACNLFEYLVQHLSSYA